MKLIVQSIDKMKDKKGKEHKYILLEYDKAFRDWICGSEGWERLTKKRVQKLIDYSMECLMEDWYKLKEGEDVN